MPPEHDDRPAPELASPPIDFAKLAPWIQPRHLTRAAVDDLARRYREDPDRCLILDDFLVAERLDTLRTLVVEESRLKPVYKLYGKAGWVDEAAFLAAPEERRFIFEEVYAGPRSGRELGRPMVAGLMFRKFIAGAPFLAFLSAIIGQPAEQAEVSLKRLGREHFIRRHSDALEGRVACMVLYLHQGWRAEYRGRFVLFRNDGGEEVVEPLTNRLLLFDPHAGTEHEVEPLDPGIGDWTRSNYTVWFSRSVDSQT